MDAALWVLQPSRTALEGGLQISIYASETEVDQWMMDTLDRWGGIRPGTLLLVRIDALAIVGPIGIQPWVRQANLMPRIFRAIRKTLDLGRDEVARRDRVRKERLTLGEAWG